MKQKVAIIGAGISGVYAARELAKIADVTVFEKSRGFGGRMATRTKNEYHNRNTKFIKLSPDQFMIFFLK